MNPASQQGNAPPAARGLRRAISAVAVTAAALLAACATAARIPDDRPLTPLTAAAAELSARGSTAVTVEAGLHNGKYGCTVPYEIYRPARARGTAMVVLAHGFMRDLESMRGWAAHWASYGVPVTVMSLCNSRWFAGRHERNAADLVALARAIHRGPILYAGFSSGGLAACLAAVEDPRALAYLGLDSVDSRDLAVSAAPVLDVPALFLLAEPSPVNAGSNILRAVTASANRTDPPIVLRILDAAHCAFENPGDPRCRVISAWHRPEEASETLLDTIRSLATAWVLAQVLEDPKGEQILDAAAAGGGQWRGRVELILLPQYL